MSNETRAWQLNGETKLTIKKEGRGEREGSNIKLQKEEKKHLQGIENIWKISLNFITILEKFSWKLKERIEEIFSKNIIIKEEYEK